MFCQILLQVNWMGEGLMMPFTFQYEPCHFLKCLFRRSSINNKRAPFRKPFSLLFLAGFRPLFKHFLLEEFHDLVDDRAQVTLGIFASFDHIAALLNMLAEDH